METITKIDAPKHGTDFLASSHFKIGQEAKWLVSKNPGAYKSTFKNDYPPRRVGEREKTSQLPPAQIVHRDMRVGDQFLSITRDHFGPKELSKTSYEDMPYALSTTNFKMDADEKTKSFRTTNNEYFYEKSLADAKNDSHVKDWTKSHIPQGDKDKITWEQSDYRAHFVPLRAKLEPIKHKGSALGEPPTIKGDIRIHRDDLYGTTMRECFPSKYQKQTKVDESIRYPASHIPQGDVEKCKYYSTQQEDFKVPTEQNIRERAFAQKRLQGTTFIMGDQRLESFRSTIQDSFPDVTSEGRTANAKMDMSKSNLPSGDTDYFKNLERISETTNSNYYKPPPPEFKNPIVDGSAMRTASNVHFGKDTELTTYTTTMQDNFKSVKCKTQKALGNVHSSSIPLDYYQNLIAQPTYRADYTANSEASKLEPNPVALNKLKRSNFNITDPLFREYNTTHQVTYTPKDSRRNRATETGKLQKSSVPLGTLER